MLIRNAELDDCLQLEHIIQSTFHLSCPPESDRELQKAYINENLTAEHFKKMVCDTDCKIWLAIDDEQVIGLVVMSTEPNSDVVLLSKIYVLTEYHGKGVAKALHHKLVHFSQSQNYKKIRLYVYSKNMRAKTFYEKSGFVWVAHYKYHMMSECFDDHIYELSLIDNESLPLT